MSRPLTVLTRPYFALTTFIILLLCYLSRPHIHTSWNQTQRPYLQCTPPRENIFLLDPLRPTDCRIKGAAKRLDKWLTKRVQSDDIDSISLAVVSPSEILFHGGYGVVKANESHTVGLHKEQQRVDLDTIYRIASISKMFTVLETLILRERGALNWDDPVYKYVPDFSPPTSSWAAHLSGAQDNSDPQKITLRQLASHLGGVGRDFPPFVASDWPKWVPPDSPTKAPSQGRQYKEMMDAVTKYPLINVPYTYPIYSNTGIDLLGMSNIAANKIASDNPSIEPETHRDLIKRDIFLPLQMNSSFFRDPPVNLLDSIAVASRDSEWADFWLGDVDDPAGGQYSSMKDLIRVMQHLLSPATNKGVLPARVIREWTRPLFTWDFTLEQVGAPWEIMDFEGTKGYTKGGNLPGHHTLFALFPEYSYGIIALVTGTYTNTHAFVKEAAKHFQPAISHIHDRKVHQHYGGYWANDEGDIAIVSLNKHTGALFLNRLTVQGVDVLKKVEDFAGPMGDRRKAAPVALWSTGRSGEFRMAFGRPELNNVPGTGCEPYWVSIDGMMFSKGAPIDLIYWSAGKLHYPSGGTVLQHR